MELRKLLPIFSCFSLHASGTPPPATESFESGVPKHWTAGGEADISVTEKCYKDGGHSLSWKWNGPDQALVFHNPEVFRGRTAESAFGIWVHNAEPSRDTLRVEFLNEGKVVKSCWFWMDFRGWRPLGASYAQIGCKPDQPIDGLRLLAPKGMDSGRLHLDCARFNFRLAGGMDTRSWQAPWIGVQDGLNHPGRVVLSDRDISLNRKWLPARKAADAISQQERADLEKLAQRLLPPISRKPKGLDAGILNDLRKRMAEYRIQRRGGTVTGRPVDGGSMITPADSIPVWEYLKFCSAVQRAHDQALVPGEIQELRGMFVDLCAHFLDQGWSMGTRLGGWDNYPGEKPDSIFLMRDILAEEGLLRGMALAMADRFGCQDPCQYLAEHPSSSMDGLGFWNNQLMSCVLMLPDEGERLQHVRAVQRFYSLALVHPGTIAPDGCTYHHGGFHFAYASYNLPRLLRVLKAASDTGFRIAPRAHERLRTYVRAIAFTLGSGHQAYNIGMRAGTPLSGDMSSFAAELATMGTPDGTGTLDEEMAGLAIWCVQQNAVDVAKRLGREPYRSWIARGIKAQPLTGHLTLNGSPLAIHRGNGWMASIAGMSSHWRGVEIYGWTQSNNYGRFARNGSICVMPGDPPSLENSGWSYDGWNWCHFPGATTLIRHPEELFDGYAMYQNGSPFAGGTQLGGNGIWGMDYTGGNGVAFKKSYFCFDNRITSVTTGVRTNPKLESPAVTTLFQNRIHPDGCRVLVDGETPGAFPLERTLEGGRNHWIMDGVGTGYFIPRQNAPLRIALRGQQWLYPIRKHLVDPGNDPLPTNNDYRNFHSIHKSLKQIEKHYRPSKGDFELAWFDHGPEAVDGSCTYTMVMNTDRDKMGAMSNNPPWTILRNDASAHIVTDHASRTTGYVLFEPSQAIQADGILAGNSQPCFVMARMQGEAMRLAVAQTNSPSDAALELALKGNWKLKEPSQAAKTIRAGHLTRLTLRPDGFTPMEVDLVRE